MVYIRQECTGMNHHESVNVIRDARVHGSWTLAMPRTYIYMCAVRRKSLEHAPYTLVVLEQNFSCVLMITKCHYNLQCN